MSDKLTLAKEMESIKDVLRKYPEGTLIDNIEAESNLKIPRRTLQRRLFMLGQAGEVHTQGKTRAAKYFLVAEKNIAAPTIKSSIPLSKEGESILRQITRPIQQRTPVSYHRDYLEAYKPNTSHYLTLAEREELERIGKTVMPDQPAGTYAKEILTRLLLDLSWNSSRLEGNTYSLLDTQRLISFGEAAKNRSATEAQMILNHKDAIEFLVESTEDIGFNRYTILNLHALLSNNLLPDPGASGRLRTFGVGIHQSVYEPLAVPQLISELFDLILEKAEQIQNPFEQAFFIMVQLPYLHPFDDVNKRVSRLAMNIPFSRYNLAPLSFVDVPDDLYIQGMIAVYELNRIELLKDVFLWAYKRSAARYAVQRQSLGEPDPFRLKYRENMSTLITEIISQSIKPKEASEKIKTAAEGLPTQDQQKFIEAVETELLSLHEGNFARYHIRPSEYKTWKNIWDLDQ
jgi:fido (protein-threonine AMPylation protein)